MTPPQNPIRSGRSIAMLALVLALVALIATCAGGGGGSSRSEDHFRDIVQRGVLRVGTTGDFYPFSLRDAKTNSYQGYDIDVARQLAKDLGVRLEFVQTSWQGLVSGMLAGKYDIALSGITVTMERMKSVGFSDSYVAVRLVPLIRKEDTAKFRNWQDLDRPEVTIAVELGTSSESIVRGLYKKARIIAVEAPTARSYQEVLTRRADAGINDILTYSRAAEKYPTLMVLNDQDPVGLMHNGIMLQQGDQVLLNWLNAWVKTRTESRFFEELNAKWKNLPAGDGKPAAPSGKAPTAGDIRSSPVGAL